MRENFKNWKKPKIEENTLTKYNWVVRYKEQIKRAIKRALYDEKFREKVKKCINPYGDGKTGKRIANILSKIKTDKKLLQKQIAY
jgi:UDP-N-acetylglucosamine 2-epimerase